MKAMRSVFAMALCLLIATGVFAQKVKVVSGSFAALKGQTTLNVSFSYDGMTVGKENEDNYIKRTIESKNKMKPGDGDAWAVKWKEDRTARFQPEFLKILNDILNKKGITAKEGAEDARYTLVVKTLVTEPGLYTGISVAEKPTWINAEIKLLEGTTELANVLVTKSPGEAFAYANYDIGLRITNAYGKCARAIGKVIAKAIK